MFPPSGQEIIEKKVRKTLDLIFFVFGMLLNAKFSVLASAFLQNFTHGLSE